MTEFPSSPRIGAVVLAAGGSARLGFPKQLVVHNGEPLVRRTAKAVVEVGVCPVVVVLGANADMITSALVDLPWVTIVVNEDWSRGLASSLRVGVAAVLEDPGCDAVLVTLADQPLVDARALQQLVGAFDGERRLVASAYDGIIGVPAVFGREHAEDLMNLTGDAGAGSWLRNRADDVTCLPLSAAAIDIDTAGHLARLRGPAGHFTIPTKAVSAVDSAVDLARFTSRSCPTQTAGAAVAMTSMGATVVNSFNTSKMSSSIPPTIQRHLTQPESAEVAVEAMKLFIAKGDTEAFKYAVALYCTAACERKEEVQTVLGALCRLAADLERPRPAEEVVRAPSETHSLIFAGILRAFYGDTAVDLSGGASAQRKADAPQHARSGTWPNRPTDSSYHRERLTSIRSSVESRLRRVCSDLREDEFQTLVDKVAREQLRGESRPNFG